ncbi:GNAT family N-acetyltransferase [Rhizobiaceae bacterium BDR2-2]|uniref:GNAT family N-acetyltransferase n=1 Tax=Ectorhizobium quercum TaxID=2965071 RepID=A0AAE3N3K6_9HYPH|nr:GNAT family N-acetyltransferase [Ectorhizobium quercum]MCX8999964.1 GNAT family N-acetyltransferase [Ectorhizobium quercum]
MNSNANRMVGALSGAGHAMQRPDAERAFLVGREQRQFCIYPARAGYDLQDELDFLSRRAMEPNVFFMARFLAPAMPRLDERNIRIAIIRDESPTRSRMRLLMPFSVEKPGFSVGPSIVRSWANPFVPLGTPLVDTEGAAETIDDLLVGLNRPEAGLPGVLVLPEMRLNGPFARMVRTIAIGRNLPVTVTGNLERPMLESVLDGEAYLRDAMSAHHTRDMRRLWNKLSAQGELAYNVARTPDDVRIRMEEFLALEANGWKGRKRTAMVIDRYRSAFVREAITNLSESDSVRIHTLDFNGQAIASMIVFVASGEAFTWKTAYDEAYSAYSPGKLLVARLTEWHLDDANVERTDSCAVPDHPVMSRMWKERMEMGTIVIGLTPNSDRDVRQAASQLHLYRNTRNMARMLRNRIMSMTGRD